MNSLCVCGSGKPYKNCCKIFHDGTRAPNALLLMRSRYAAYAHHQAEYIIRTTHPDNPHYQHDHPQWTKEILHFCKNTQFERLDILEFIDGEQEAYVTFTAHLKQHDKEATFTEKSRFKKEGDQWLYLDGVIS